MAITQRPSGRWQVKLRQGGHWVTETFDDKKAAKQAEALLKSQILSGERTAGSQATVDEYFVTWFEQVKHTAGKSWRHEQRRRYELYVRPLIGSKRLKDVKPAMIGDVLNGAREQGLSEQTCLHIYCLVHKMFGDAVELFRAISFNPVIRTLRPRPPEKEAKHLTVEQAAKLLTHVEGKPFELGVWLALYVGLRVGEVQALRWDNVDLERGVIHIRASYVRKEKRIKDYPKGKKWHSHRMPPELWERLTRASVTAESEFVVTSPRREMMNYEGFRGAMKRYCKQAGVTGVVAHGLRHSTSGIYMAKGATRDDIRKLFNHSADSVTDRYVHDRGERVDEVARSIRLLPLKPVLCSPNVPRELNISVEQSEKAC